MSAGQMTGIPHGRHRLGVLPGLSSRSESMLDGRVNDIASALATLDDESRNKQLVPLSRPQSKPTKAWTALKSRDTDDSVGYYFRNVSTRVATLEEANKAILEEVYRLQSNVRASEFDKKGLLKEEKRAQRELMDTIRSSNDVVAQLTSRLRKAEEKLHRERENVQNLMTHSKKLEQILFNAQKEADSQRDAQNLQAGDMKHRIEDLIRKWEKNDRTSESIIDEFHQLKSKVDIQAMEFVHLQTELKQKSKRTEDELRQSLQQAKFQQDTNSIAEQKNIQLRHLLEARMSETRDAVNDLRNRITQAESNTRSQVQQLQVKMSDIHSNISDLSHKRQEELQNLEKSRQENHHLEENERYKLQNKIQTTFDELNEKMLQKEVRLREEALKKFVDVEKLFQKEESERMKFEKHLRDDVDARWSMQHKLYVEEMQALKEVRRSDKAQQIASIKKIDECIVMLDKKIKLERKALEKVLYAEITKREAQTRKIVSQVDGVKEQLRVALSTLQEAIGGLQVQTTHQKEQILNELKKRVSEEHESTSRLLGDTDARITAVAARVTQQDEALEMRMNNFQETMQKESNELLRSTTEWREITDKDIGNMRESMKDIPQEMRETQERIGLLKADSDTRFNLEAEYRIKELDLIRKDVIKLLDRLNGMDDEAIKEKRKQGLLETQVITLQASMMQLEQLSGDVRNNIAARINSETKMRLEETGAIKRDLARLRVELQPLMWRRNTSSSRARSFIKAPGVSLNEWGIYQCARWYDIKMRWLRLLDRSRKRKMGMIPNMESIPQPPSESPSRGESVSPNTGMELKPNFASNPPTPRSNIGSIPPSPRPDSKKSRFSTPKRENLTPRNLSPSFAMNAGHRVASVTPDEISEYGDLPPRESPGDAGESPNIPEPAWYNRENIYEEEDNGMDRSRSGVGMDPSYMDEDTPGMSRELSEVSRDNGVIAEEEPRNLSGSSQKRKGSGTSKRASPSEQQNEAKPPTRLRKTKISPVTSRGKSYDMEGSR